MNARTWMTVKQVREELHYDTDDAARKWLRRMRIAGISRYPGGRTKVFARSDVEQALTHPGRRRQYADEAQGLGAPVPTGGVGSQPAVRSSHQEEGGPR